MGSEVFPTAAEARGLAFNWTLVNTEATTIQADILAAIYNGLYNTNVTNSPMTNPVLGSPMQLTINQGTSIFATSVPNTITTGSVVTFTTDTQLPTPIQALTFYYAIVLNNMQFQVATTKANAMAGNFIVLTSPGAGNSYVTLQTQSALYYAAYSGNSLDPTIANPLQDQMSSIINYYSGLGYNISQVVNPATNATFMWSISW
jgi:hypothetical protein